MVGSCRGADAVAGDMGAQRGRAERRFPLGEKGELVTHAEAMNVTNHRNAEEVVFRGPRPAPGLDVPSHFV